MQEEEKQRYLEEYKQAKEKGVPFFPDVLFKDAVISLFIFAVLIALAYFVGSPLEERADPGDTTYTPRPEWYFLFAFQLLKYFPGQLEVIGVFVIPTLVILLLFALPFIDRTPARHFRARLGITAVTGVAVVAIGLLTLQALREAPPPAEAVEGDPTALLYAKNCATCHGGMVTVSPGTDLHGVIAEGRHEGMPAWSGDLTSDQIDALAGFILSPGGSTLFNNNCSACHETTDLVASDPIQLRNVLNQGPDFEPHVGVEVPDWTQVLAPGDATDLLNFLIAPDGHRLFSVNCSPCHGSSVAFSGSDAELLEIISRGGLHLEMPPWRGMLSDSELDTLARFVVDPSSAPDGATLYDQNCTGCHGQLIPTSESVSQAREIIASGGSHETMPVWGETLTPEQLDALVSYTLEATRGSPIEVGRELFAQNCASCHGDFGEGGPNPTRPDDIIAPISTAEYLATRDDTTLRAIVAAGQPNFGMSPFSTAFGGPLDDDEIDGIVRFIRSWQANPPVELPPEIDRSAVSVGGADIYHGVCAQCHGPTGEGLVGPSLKDAEYQSQNSDQDIANVINFGHDATPMISWGEILNSEQIAQLVAYIRDLAETDGEVSIESPSFSSDVLPILVEKCAACHGIQGGWDATSYEAVVRTGDHAPVVIPGDADGSLLAQKMLGTQTEGAIMPPAGRLPDAQLQIILNWITEGAQNN